MTAAAIKQLSVSYHVCSKQNQISSNRAAQMEEALNEFKTIFTNGILMH